MSRQGSLYESVDDTYVTVALQVPLQEVFTYAVPRGWEAWVEPGSRVRVVFGGRSMEGVVVERDVAPPAHLEAHRVRPLEDCIDRMPAVTTEALRLAHDVAAAYCAGVGEVTAACLPPVGDDAGRGRQVRALDIGSLSDAPARRFVAAMGKQDGRWVDLGRVLGRARLRSGTAVLWSLLASGKVEVRDEWLGASPLGGIAMIRLAANVATAQLDEATARAPAQRRLAAALLEVAASAAIEGQVLDAAECTPAIAKALEAKGLVERFRAAPQAAAEEVESADPGPVKQLTPAQAAALATILEAVEERHEAPIVLHGVTGSGKTEVYLRAAAQVAARGCGVLLLVPEIGLTPQLAQRARDALGDRVVVMHSGLSAGERAAAWWRVRRGRARIVVGPRSAAFAPIERLGLVVIDEEQDSAYKQEERPRYNGRDVALRRARNVGAVVVLGSATPAIETYRSASTGAWRLATMPERVADRSLPVVRLVDMRQEWTREGRTLLSRDLEEALIERLEAGEQVLLLLNRRGFAGALWCRACGDRGECPNCAVSLTFHRRDRSLRCHYCDHRERAASTCPQCGVDALFEVGHGTEQLHDVVAGLRPGVRVERFDADQTRRKGAHSKILSRFAQGRTDVLVGTQMLAKGHDFPGVTLVGIIDADASLSVPDYLAAERTFQLLTQMAGRAGRGDVAGEVVIQASQTDHYAIEAACGHDYEGFYRREIEFRRDLRYPPFSALAVCLCRGKLAVDVRADADRLRAVLGSEAGSGTEVLGPVSPPISRLRGKYRQRIMIKAARRQDLVELLQRACTRLRREGTMPTDMVIDIDPRNLM